MPVRFLVQKIPFRRTRSPRISLNWLNSRRIIFIIKSSTFENFSQRVSSRLHSLRFVTAEICMGVLIETFQISFSTSGRLYCSRTKPRRFYFRWYSSMNNKNVRISSTHCKYHTAWNFFVPSIVLPLQLRLTGNPSKSVNVKWLTVSIVNIWRLLVDLFT